MRASFIITSFPTLKNFLTKNTASIRQVFHANISSINLSREPPHFSLKEAGKVTLKIYSLQGQVIRTLFDEEEPVGSYSLMWNDTDEKGVKVSAGTYLYALQVNGFEQLKKLVFMK